MCGARCSRRSPGSRPIGSSTTSCRQRSASRSRGSSTRCEASGLREYDRRLQLRPRRHAGRPRRHAREVAQRLRGGPACPVHRLEPAAPGGPREIDVPTSHADLIPTLLGLAGIDHDEALAKLSRPHRRPPACRSRPLGCDPRAYAGGPVGARAVHDRRRDQRGQHAAGASPFQGFARKPHVYCDDRAAEPHRDRVAEVDVDGATHLVKFSRYHDNQQFWTVPGERDERLRGRKTITVTEPEPDDYELYDLTLDPFEERNLAHPSTRTTRRARFSRRCSGSSSSNSPRNDSRPQPASVPGYRPPAVS